MPQQLQLKRKSGTRKANDRAVRSVCRECTVGCGLIAYIQDHIIVDVMGDEEHPVSRGRVCAKGTDFVRGIRSPERIMFPGARNRPSGPFAAMENIEKAMDGLADALKRVRDRSGPGALAVGCDPEAGLDFYLGARRFARLWETPHVYHPLDNPIDNPFGHPANDPGNKPLYQEGTSALTAPTAPCTEWEESGSLFLVEADPAATHPVAFGKVLQAKARGAKIIAADVCFTATLSKADLPLLIPPGSGNLLGMVLLKGLMELDGLDNEAAAAGLDDPEGWRATFENFSLADGAKALGLTPEAAVGICRMLVQHAPVTAITGKRLAYQPDAGVWQTLAAAAGWTSRVGGGWYPLEAGRPRLAAAGDIENPRPGGREIGFPYQGGSGADAPQGIKAVIASGNCFNDFFLPFKVSTREMDLIVHFGAFANLTRDLAHMILPSALWPERNGLCFSNDRGIQFGPRLVSPQDACQTGLGFWMRLADRFGWGDHFPWRTETGRADPLRFYDWVLARNPDTAGLTVEALKASAPEPIFWPLDRGRGVKRTSPPFPTDSGKIPPAPAPEKISLPDGGTAQTQDMG